MECRDAQFYLRLQRHTADELGADVTGALDGHLATCPGCARDARSARSFDRVLGSAMRAVVVPVGLREMLITRAAAKQGAILRRQLLRAAAACAAVVVLLGIGFGVFSSTRPILNPEELVKRAGADPEESTRQFLVGERLPDRLPLPFDYDLFMYHGFEDVQGKRVPFVLFRAPQGSGFAKVYIFRPDGRFDMTGVRDAQSSSARAQVKVDRGFTYVILYTTPQLEPFLRPGPSA